MSLHNIPEEKTESLLHDQEGTSQRNRSPTSDTLRRQSSFDKNTFEREDSGTYLNRDSAHASSKSPEVVSNKDIDVHVEINQNNGTQRKNSKKDIRL